MNPRDAIVVRKTGKRSFAVEGKGGNYINLVGTNYLETSVNPQSRRLENFFVVNTNGYPGVLAIQVQTENKHGASSFFFFLDVEIREDGPFVNLDKAWFPKDMVVHVDDEGVSVMIDRQYYRSIRRDDREPGIHYVRSAQIICSYLCGIATAKDVIDDVMYYKEEISAREKLKEVVYACNTIAKRLEKSEADAKYHEENAQKTRHALDCASVLLGNNSKKIDELTEVLKDLKEFFMVVGGMLSAKGKIEGDDEKTLTDLYDEIASKHHEPLNILKP